MSFDVIVAGGSYSGISAALQLARARRRVLVLDSGIRRNRFAEHSHGFFGQDGRSPAAIVEEARTQLKKYPDVTWVDTIAESVIGRDDMFFVETSEGCYTGNRLIIATGIADDLPHVPGLQERWGKSVFHCPYCHGYELQKGRIGVLATGDISLHHAVMLPDWGQTTLFTNGALQLNAEQLEQLRARNVTIEYTQVAEIAGAHADVRLQDGRTIVLDGLFTAPRIRMASPLAQQLGCEFEDGPLGAFLKTDAVKQTSVPSVFACGDIARAAGSIALAVGDGAIAGTAAHRSLIFP